MIECKRNQFHSILCPGLIPVGFLYSPRALIVVVVVDRWTIYLLLKIWKQFFTLKTHQLFTVHTSPEKFQNTTMTVNLDLYKTQTGESRDFVTSSFLKSSVFNNLVPRVLSLPRESRESTLGTRLRFQTFFLLYTKTQNRRFQIAPRFNFKSVYEKLRFRDGLNSCLRILYFDLLCLPKYRPTRDIHRY